MSLLIIARQRALFGLLIIGSMLVWATAQAGPHSEVASAFDEGDAFDLNFTLDYDLVIKRGTIKREFVGYPGTSADDNLPIVKDLVFSGARHTITPKLELGVFTDVSVFFALPIVLFDSRTLEFDQRGSCTFPDAGANASCVNSLNSTTVQDGLLPAGGFDSSDPTGPGFDPSSATLFKGPNRAGVDQLHLGLSVAPMNQERDDTKPTWRIGAEVRLAIGSPMKFNRADPESERSVGRGIHEFRAWTSIAKRLTWAEPYMTVWWQAPLTTKSGSQFIEPGFGQSQVQAQQTAGTTFGFEATVWKDEESANRLSLEVGTDLRAHFEGRGYSQMWEVFQYAGDANFLGNPLILDSDPTNPGDNAISHPGVSNIENYLSFAGNLGVRAELGERIRFGLGFELSRDQAHFITFADAGIDQPLCPTATDEQGCETLDNELVDLGTDEVNPLHVPLMDTVGRRYRVEGITNYSISIDMRILL